MRKKKNVTEISEDWRPSERTKTWFKQNYPQVDVDNFVEQFIDGCLAGGYVYANYDAAIRNWARRQENAKSRANSGKNGTRCSTWNTRGDDWQRESDERDVQLAFDCGVIH